MKKIFRFVRYVLWISLLGGIIVMLSGIRGCYNSGNDNWIEFGGNKKIDPSPIQIESIHKIQQWEFLSIDDEELIDTTITHWWKSNEHLVRIYRGCIRLGIDFKECKPNWAMSIADTAIITLPGIKLLDPNFIDEARTRSFHEDGEWNANAYQQLYKRAQREMLKKALTEKNIQKAEENATAQVSNLFRTLVYANIKVTISPSSLRP